MRHVIWLEEVGAGDTEELIELRAELKMKPCVFLRDWRYEGRHTPFLCRVSVFLLAGGRKGC